MTWHLLKISPENFEANLSRTKTCETRLNDRDFKCGDVLVLQEWRGLDVLGRWKEGYTGRVAIYYVTHCTYTKDLPMPRDKAVTPIDWAVMSIVPWDMNYATRAAQLTSDKFTLPGDYGITDCVSRSGGV